MPPFYRQRYFYRRQRRRPRYRRYYRQYRHWRPRKAVRRRYRFHRRRRWVRKTKNFKKKLKFLYLKEYQPKKIRKCAVKGLICLFQCGPHRLHREWTNFINSYYPAHNEGGGGWSQLKFSLESLFEQRELLRNKWTQSNVYLPLVRYTGCKITFYRTQNVDYIVNYCICLPMLDTLLQHTNAQPNNMLLYPHKIIIPSLQTKPWGKLYIKKKIRPPEQFQNKWYFQSDLNKQPLLLLTTSAMSLNRYYLNPQSVSNNITLKILNISLFKHHYFTSTKMGTEYWHPGDVYLYASLQNPKPKVKELIFLGQTQRYSEGIPINNTPRATYLDQNKALDYWGNIFHERYMNYENHIFVSKNDPNTVFSDANITANKLASDIGVTEFTQQLYTEVRYTPERDTGENLIYLLKTSDNTLNWEPSDDPDLNYEGYPLWCLLWGYIDWQIKYKKAQQVDQNYILVIDTNFTYPIKKRLVVLDDTFIKGKSPWQETNITPTDFTNWHPQVKFQERSIENICETGPGTCKTFDKSIEAHCKYSFYFKWGGCPNELQHITDPADQRHYPVPNNQLQGPQIQDPKTTPTKELYDFDWRREMLTERAAKRIKKDSKHEKFFITDSGTSKLSSETQAHQKIPTFNETSSEEEEETEMEQQLLQLKHKQHKLKNKLRQLISHTPNIKY
nr:MAG: ORF1 [TTV-like mini virus]